MSTSGMIIGYARVSTYEQNLELQISALLKAGIDKRNLFQDKISGSKFERPGLQEALKYMNRGDTFIVWKLDRLGRSISNLIKILQELQDRGIEFKSLTESIDTSTPSGKLFFHISSAFCQFERDLIRERTLAGLAAAKARGKIGGRPRLLGDQERKVLVHDLAGQSKSISYIAKMLNVSRATIYRELERKMLS